MRLRRGINTSPFFIDRVFCISYTYRQLFVINQVSELREEEANMVHGSVRTQKDDRKVRALMMVIERIVARHHRGLVILDEPSFELFEMAKSIERAANEEDLQRVLTKLAEFNK